MPTALIDGISTRYEVLGSGPPLLMFSPGGFDATLEKWSTLGVYARIKLLDHLVQKYSCIVFDRRETGQSGGRIERVTWADYVAQGKGLLDHLNIAQAHLMGGCMGCSPVVAFGAMHPQATLSMVLYWPVGGARYRINGHQRFAEHLAFVQQNGLAAVAELVARDAKPFNADPRGGPWASVLRHDRAFADNYVKQSLEHYKLVVAGMARTLLDRDTAPGAEPEDLLRLDIPTAKFGQPEINLGIIAGMGGTQRLARAVGKAKAMDMNLTGRMMDAAEAERSGLVARVVPAATLLDEARAMATKIAAKSQIATMAAKEAVNRAYESTLAEGLIFERRLFQALFATEDQKEGMAAFVAKREAQFRDR